MLSLCRAVLGSKCFQLLVQAPEEREDGIVAQHMWLNMCQLGCEGATIIASMRYQQKSMVLCFRLPLFVGSVGVDKVWSAFPSRARGV
ncbi:hypothetical protein CXF97_12730 [Pseudomonas sp. Choline-02u-1]|nr:hypothetical protein CXF97_12730 [Pseudomonas sp. Choline-02u-1]